MLGISHKFKGAPRIESIDLPRRAVVHTGRTRRRLPFIFNPLGALEIGPGKAIPGPTHPQHPSSTGASTCRSTPSSPMASLGGGNDGLSQALHSLIHSSFTLSVAVMVAYAGFARLPALPFFPPSVPDIAVHTRKPGQIPYCAGHAVGYGNRSFISRVLV